MERGRSNRIPFSHPNFGVQLSDFHRTSLSPAPPSLHHIPDPGYDRESLRPKVNSKAGRQMEVKVLSRARLPKARMVHFRHGKKDSDSVRYPVGDHAHICANLRPERRSSGAGIGAGNYSRRLE